MSRTAASRAKAIAGACVLALLVLTGCDAPHQLTDTGAIHSVGIVAAVPETVELEYAGLLSGHKETAPVPWALNQAVVAAATDLLQHRFTVRVISTTATVEHVPEYATTFGSSGSMASDLAKIVKPSEFDAVLVVTGVNGCYVFFESGLMRQRYPAYMALGYHVGLFDGRTLKPLAIRDVEVPNPVKLSGRDNPYQDIDFGWRGEPFESVPESQKQLMKTVALQLIRRGLEFSIPRLGLTP